MQEKSKATKQEIGEAEGAAVQAAEIRDKALAEIGNLVHDTVPVSNDEVGELQKMFSCEGCFPKICIHYSLIRNGSNSVVSHCVLEVMLTILFGHHRQTMKLSKSMASQEVKRIVLAMLIWSRSSPL